jgi:tripartite-type tricarboxylate transporter receptor subunit TctC
MQSTLTMPRRTRSPHGHFSQVWPWAFAAAFTAVVPPSAQAQSVGAESLWPVKPVRIIVPAVPGGGTDILARLLSPRLTEHFGQTVIVDNRGGAFTNSASMSSRARRTNSRG